MELAKEHYVTVFAHYTNHPTEGFELRVNGHHALVRRLEKLLGTASNVV